MKKTTNETTDTLFEILKTIKDMRKELIAYGDSENEQVNISRHAKLSVLRTIEDIILG